MSADYYGELGVGRGASADEIKRAYRKLASQLHPDRNQDNPVAEERFKRVNTAFGVLSDPKKKQLYDKYGEMGLKEGFDPNMGGFGGFGRRPAGGGGVNFEDMFGGSAGGGGIGDIFGDIFGGGKRGQRRPQKAPDAESEITVEFLSAVRGAELELSIQGKIVKVRIPQGARDGDKLRVKGQGGGPPGMPPGDLLLVLKVKDHQHLERDGLDLTLPLPITAKEAFGGGKVEVPTLDGTVSLKVPPHTQSGQLLRLRGKGVKRGKNAGDLYVRFQIQLPKDDDEKLAKAIETLAEATPDDLRDDIQF